jgi:hypothetical protein
MREFTILEEYLTDVPKYLVRYKHDTTKELTNEQLVDILVNGNVSSTTIWHECHPKFTELREQLEQEGYIKTERSWLNGDRVLKSFKLNEKMFKKSQQFPCAAALKWQLKYKD